MTVAGYQISYVRSIEMMRSRSPLVIVWDPTLGISAYAADNLIPINIRTASERDGWRGSGADKQQMVDGSVEAERGGGERRKPAAAHHRTPKKATRSSRQKAG